MTLIWGKVEVLVLLAAYKMLNEPWDEPWSAGFNTDFVYRWYQYFIKIVIYMYTVSWANISLTGLFEQD